jgi:hypothetical protein
MIQIPKNYPRNADLVFWDKDGILHVYYLEKCATITAKHSVALLDKLKQKLVSKRRGNLSKVILLLQDGAAPHKANITHQKLADIHFEVLKHVTWSPALAPSNYYFFPNLKGRKFSNIEKVYSTCGRVVCSTTKKIFS